VSLLELRDIVAGYADHKVLHGVSLAAGRGSVTAILGPNGVGKTTLLNVALGWIRPTSGRVALDGRELVSLSGSERGRQLSLVPQSDHIPFDYSILEYVLLGRAPYIGQLQTPGANDVQLAREALDRVGLGGMGERGVLETSAGERQLVLLARSLAQDPAVLLLDEPSAHLDLANKRRLVELLRREAERGCCIVLTAHEPEFAAAVADWVTLLRDGSVLASGPPDQVMTGELLTTTYGVPITVHRVTGRPTFLW
jgi:iron complex transport system ATP-binding protein